MLLKPDTTLSSSSHELRKSNSQSITHHSPKNYPLTPDRYKTTFSLFSNSTRDRSLGKVNSAGSRLKSNLKSSSSKKSKIMEIMAQDAKADGINRAINRSLETSAKWINTLEKDKKAINDCLYLNSLRNDTEMPSLNDIDQTTLTKTQRDELLIDRKELNNKQPYELSPMKLKNRFEKDDKTEKNKAVQLDNLKNELQKFTTDQKNQTEYLKVVVLALDSKLKGLLNVEKDNEILGMELGKSEEMRKEFEKALRDSNNQAKLDQMGNQTIFNKIMEEKHVVDEKMKEMNKNFERIHSKTPEISVENELREAKINLRNFEF